MNETFETSQVQSKTPMSFMKRMFMSSKKMIIIVAAYVISLVSGLIGVLATNFKLMDFVNEFLAMVEESGATIDTATQEAIDWLSSIANTVDTLFVVIGIAGLIPAALMAAGVLLIYFGVMKDDASKVSIGALLFRILFIYQIVLQSLAVLLVLLCSAMLSIAFTDFAALVILLSIFILVPLVLTITYYGKFEKMLKNLGLSARTGINTLKVSSYVTVITKIAAILGIISAVLSIGSSLIGSLGDLLSSVALLFVADLFVEYKDEMGAPTPEDIQAAKERK
jgi:hypothetical protein